jgi:hypothetical protein
MIRVMKWRSITWVQNVVQMGAMRNANKIWLESLKGRDHSKGLGVRNIILKRTLVKYVWSVLIAFICVRFRVFTAARMKIRDFWDVAPCSLVGVDRRFRGTYCRQYHSSPWRWRSTHHSNVGQLQRDYTALYPTRLYCAFIWFRISTGGGLF